uniref:Small ribosomal subunit protein bS20c n=1 Tax=Osmundaria fimbriata TaxID=228265 RepID=A0A1Z1M4R3_OSMFI|nr:ribosomal protein S20 [Osmundaria fimbriata]ARW60831.1 ribosomal protein S20 [Osmundaria fimbriata]
MPQILSGTKNTRIILRNRYRNRKYKLSIKAATKKYLISLYNINNVTFDDVNLVVCQNNLSAVYQKIDKAVKKKVLHKNTASRKKARLSQMLKASNMNVEVN